MRAIQIESYGSADVLKPAEVPVPEPGPGEVLVRLARAGVNFIDVYMREGIYKRSDTYANRPPFTLGMEGAGTVERLGEGVAGPAVGRQVAYCLARGSYADFAVVPAWRLVEVPEGVEWDIATALMLQGSTAHYLSHSLFPLRSGQTCLVHAAAGGVGQLLVQLAKRRGARVLATVGSPEKAEVARKRGADVAILYREVDFREAVMAETEGKGVDVVYDSVGQATFAHSLRSLRRRGTCVLFGAASGVVEAVDPLEVAEAGSVFFTRPHLADYMTDAEEIRGRARDLFAAVAEGTLAVTIGRRYDLARAAEAHRALEGRASGGKIVLTVSEDARLQPHQGGDT